MKESVELKIDAGAVVPAVGDRKRLKGSARATLDEGGLRLSAGDDIEWSIELRRLSGGLEVSGTISGAIELRCYRCLEPYSLPLAIDLHEHALWFSEEEATKGDDYGDEYLVTDGILDLEPVLRDAVCLSIPSTHVCAEDCVGLCALCGANLNAGECGCDRRRVDVRLKPLEELKKKLEGRQGEGG